MVESQVQLGPVEVVQKLRNKNGGVCKRTVKYGGVVVLESPNFYPAAADAALAVMTTRATTTVNFSRHTPLTDLRPRHGRMLVPLCG